jgi:SAM-dependent methyltransferase
MDLKQRLSGLWRDRVDWKYRADTGGIITHGELGVDASNAAYATCYRAALGWVIRRFLRQLPIDFTRYTFVDFGSGKGRALLVASEFAFAEIVGVEFSADLLDISRRNIARLPARNRRDDRIRATLGDAAEFALPQTDLVCYLYNPFGPPVIDRVVARIAAHSRAGFDVFIVYINPKHRDAITRTGRFDAVFEHVKGVIYRGRGTAHRAPARSASHIMARLKLVMLGALALVVAILAVSLFDPALLGIGL